MILRYTHESSQAMLRAYRLARLVRGWQREEEGSVTTRELRGMSTDEEQDLLRSMVVTAASGLDSMTKQLITDALPKILDTDDQARNNLEKFLHRRLRTEEDEADLRSGASLLARVLASKQPQDTVISEYLKSLSRGSLQAVEELRKIVSAFGIDWNDLNVDSEALREIFLIRNKIIHELDVNFDAPIRNRNVRSETRMRGYTNTLLSGAQRLLTAVARKLDDAI